MICFGDTFVFETNEFSYTVKSILTREVAGIGVSFFTNVASIWFKTNHLRGSKTIIHFKSECSQCLLNEIQYFHF